MDPKTLINQWPTLKSFAADVRVPYDAARKWRKRNSIPAAYWSRVVRACRDRGYLGSLELLAQDAEWSEAS